MRFWSLPGPREGIASAMQGQTHIGSPHARQSRPSRTLGCYRSQTSDGSLRNRPAIRPRGTQIERSGVREITKPDPYASGETHQRQCLRTSGGTFDLLLQIG